MNDYNEGKLDDLFRAYRQACPDLEGSANFMPNLWRKIEARQAVPFAWPRLTRLFVSTAAALCLAMSIFLFSPVSPSPAALISYVEALDTEHSHELLAYADIDAISPGDMLWQ
ncbi:MAG TPA: hypothetical protein VM120_24305 [Bryobacteraceae bacterium]|nr:hypothetical protein [Bryobacteraceae bacterium]